MKKIVSSRDISGGDARSCSHCGVHEPYDVLTNADSQRQHCYGNNHNIGAADQAIIHYLGTTMQRLNFTVATPFSLQPSPQAGIAVYNGTVSDKNGTYAASVQACNNASTAQAHFNSLRTMFMGQGYTTVQQNATAWSGFNASAQRGASVEYGSSPLMPYYCMVITGAAAGQTSPSNNPCGSICGT